MKNIHVIPKTVWEKHCLNFKSSHFLDLPDGSVIVTSEMDDEAQKNLEAEEGVVPLPYYLSSDQIGQAAVPLKHLGIKPEHKTFEAMLILKKHHPAFSPNQF